MEQVEHSVAGGTGGAQRSMWNRWSTVDQVEHSGAGYILPINPILVFGHFGLRSSQVEQVEHSGAGGAQ